MNKYENAFWESKKDQFNVRKEEDIEARVST